MLVLKNDNKHGLTELIGKSVTFLGVVAVVVGLAGSVGLEVAGALMVVAGVVGSIKAGVLK